MQPKDRSISLMVKGVKAVINLLKCLVPEEWFKVGVSTQLAQAISSLQEMAFSHRPADYGTRILEIAQSSMPISLMKKDTFIRDLNSVLICIIQISDPEVIYSHN